MNVVGGFVLKDIGKTGNVVMSALAGSWPLVFLVVTSAGVAGIIIWLGVSQQRCIGYCIRHIMHGSVHSIC